ncbi:MAG: phosphoglycerate mutase [Luteimonas sp.]
MRKTGVTLLLPAAARFGAQRLSVDSAAALGRAQRMPQGSAGRRAQLLRSIGLPDGNWPIAALSRNADAGDAADAAWLRAEPAYLRPDINGVRLMAYGDSLGVSQADTDALLPALRPLFGDAGFMLDAPVAAHWYLRLPAAARTPGFADPGESLGEDLFEHVLFEHDASPEARRWRALLSEAQVVLHNHPHNAARAARGQLPINAIWPWGGGVLPDDRIESRSHYAIVYSNDTVARALATGACGVDALPRRFPGTHDLALFDLDAMRDLAVLDRDWLQPALAALRRGGIGGLAIDGGDGGVFDFKRWQRLKFWRKPRFRFDE